MQKSRALRRTGTGEGSHDNSKQKQCLASEYLTVIISRWGQSEQQDMYGLCDDDYVGWFRLSGEWRRRRKERALKKVQGKASLKLHLN